MPELPEVETICRSLREHVIERQIALVSYNRGDKFDEAAKSHSKKVLDLRRRGKFIIFDLGDEEMIISLGMTGKLVKEVNEKDKKHIHVAFGFMDYAKNENNELYYVDARKFGSIKVVPKGKYTGLLAELGPEPLSEDFNMDYAHEFLRKSNKSIKAVLLEQKFAAGIGNYLADEILIRTGIHPERIANTFDICDATYIVMNTVRVIEQSIASGGNSFSDYVDIEGKSGEFSRHLFAYGREGQPCIFCATPIEKITVAGRSTHYCPECQPML